MIQKGNTKECGASLRAVSKILRQEKDARIIEVNRKGKCGRKRKTTRRDEAFLMREIKKQVNSSKT